jgi:hypothetical protein
VSADVHCPHCGGTFADWLASNHQCLWLVWEQGTDECYARERKASSANQAATDYAWWEGDYGHRTLCHHPSMEMALYVRRKESAEVTPIRVMGNWHPTYQAFEGKPFETQKAATAPTSP